jgi:hypothetical protein
MVAKRFPEHPPTEPPNDGVMELSFLISGSQFAALEEAARCAGVTVAQYLRRLVQSSLARETNDSCQPAAQ